MPRTTAAAIAPLAPSPFLPVAIPAATATPLTAVAGAVAGAASVEMACKPEVDAAPVEAGMASVRMPHSTFVLVSVSVLDSWVGPDSGPFV